MDITHVDEGSLIFAAIHYSIKQWMRNNLTIVVNI
jgi:hypothetical protein